MKKILLVVFAAALAICSCTKEDATITNTLTYDGKTYEVDFQAVLSSEFDNGFDSDIHFLEDSDLYNAWGMMWATGKLGTFSLPANEEDFKLMKNTYPDYIIDFKSGTAKSWIDDNNHVCLVVDGVTTDNKKLKLSVRSMI